MSLTTGSLFSGYAGLDMAVNAYFGSRTAWFVEYDSAPSKILTHHWPDVPNHGDITTIDWAQVEPVDILTGGYPCQPFSAAGRRKGEDDERHLWPYVREAIRHLRPRYTLLENVAGHRSSGVRSSSRRPGRRRATCAVGQRTSFRCRGLPSPRAALHPRHSCRRRQHRTRTTARTWSSGRRAASGSRRRGRTATGWGRHSGWQCGSCSATADSAGHRRHEGRTESAGLVGRPHAAERGHPSSADASSFRRRRWTKSAEPCSAHG